MTGPPPPLRPEPTCRGLASSDPAQVARLVAAAWNSMIDIAGRVDLDAASRLPGWNARDVLVHLGTWPEHTRFVALVDGARQTRSTPREDVDARNALLVSRHRDAGTADIVAALETARDGALTFLASADVDRLGRQEVESPVGPLPLTGVIAASCYELAVHALDLLPPPQVPPELLDAGIAALVDTTGALAARSGVQATFAVLTPLGSWACASAPGSWTTQRLAEPAAGGEVGWPALQGEAADVLDGSAGRRQVMHLVLTRRLRMYDLAGLMTLLPALESVPGLPGGPALRTAARTLARTGRIVGRVSATIRGT